MSMCQKRKKEKICENVRRWKLSGPCYYQQRALTPMFSLFTCKSGGGGCHGNHPKTEPAQLWSWWPRDQDERVELREGPISLCGRFSTSSFHRAGAIFLGGNKKRPRERVLHTVRPVNNNLIPGRGYEIERVRDCVIGVPLRGRA